MHFNLDILFFDNLDNIISEVFIAVVELEIYFIINNSDKFTQLNELNRYCQKSIKMNKNLL